MILNPLEEYVISRQLNDPSDVGTNYVQAVIRNAKTDVIITTVNLDDKGSQRFTKTWQVVSDPTGLGLYITITTTVYTDSGYTIKSTVYGVEQHELLIQDRINPYLRGGGADVDYKRIKKMLDEALSSIPKPDKPEKVDLYPIQSTILDLHEAIGTIKLPEAKETDLRPLMVKLKLIQKSVDGVQIPECSHEEMMKLIREQTSIVESCLDGLGDQLDELKKIKPNDTMQPINALLKDLAGKIDANHASLMERLKYMAVDEKRIQSDKKKAGAKLLKEYLDD